ncbi:rhodanese-like domain-containing protein [Sinomonas sp. ASV322]|uniref:rhodanese-like domain-containing protein n=1 Tax=Sinomonas sp. ASV322 TaxID=3041920 RepID=UPI0027DD47EC|nr:rhodanese-like domain-containing protein [Sinomonas sp. ASV322]MDQ4501463.1 rhodanese-like domain-containing protein [Sinomonas sp. ASV322]
MILEQYYLGCLSHASYLVGDETTGQAVVVDPRRDIREYLDAAHVRGLTIVGVFNTHFHADFVAGHLELAAATGAWIGYGSRAEAGYPIRRFRTGDSISLGEVRLEALETPGHTWESTSLLVFERPGDPAPSAVLTGDALFIGDVGRPDLAAAVGADPLELAHAQFGSIRTLMALPAETRLLPAHGAGSACGKNLSEELESTIGAQRFMNPLAATEDEDEFVRQLMSGQPAVPAYFAFDAELNRTTRAVLGLDVQTRALPGGDFMRLRDEGARVVDGRSPRRFAAGHVPGAVNVGLGGRFAETAGMVFEARDRILVVADPGREDEAALRLARIGFDNVVGYLDGMPGALDSLPSERSERIEASELDAAIGQGALVVDVRNPLEREDGGVPGSAHIPLAEVPRRLGEIPRGADVVVYCASGWRSSVAASYLREHGYDHVRDVVGGYNAWAALRTA